MGERAGYRVRQGSLTSWVARKRVYLGGTQKKIEAWITDMAAYLLGEQVNIRERDYIVRKTGLIEKPVRLIKGWKINEDGSLREDLAVGEVFTALIMATIDSGSDSIEPTPACNISEHGLFEVELLKWNEWAINHYDVNDAGKLSNKQELGTVLFTSERTLNDGIRFTWLREFEY